jgi:hypothetical protein
MTDSLKHILIYLGIFLAGLSSIWSVYTFGVNVPHWDDHAIRLFVDTYQWSKFSSIFDFHNEHRLFLTRSVALISNAINHSLSFKILMYFGQMSLVGLMFCFVYLNRRLDLSKLPLLIIALFIFNFSTYENSLWGMAAVQNHTVMFFAIASIISIVSENKYAFGFAVFFSILAIYTSGNGVLVPIIGLILLFFKNNQKGLKYWFFIHLVILILYFIGFENSGGEKPDIEDLFLNFFALNGSLVFPLPIISLKTGLIYLAGIFNLLFATWVLFRLFIIRNSGTKLLSYIGIQAFLIGTLAAISISRNDYEILTLLSSKYKIYSFLILGVSIFYVLDSIKSIKLKISLLLCCFLLYLNTQIHYFDYTKNTFLENQAAVFNLKESNFGQSSYHLPTLEIGKHLNEKVAILDHQKIDSISYSGFNLLFFENEPNIETDNYVWLKNQKHEILVPVFLFGKTLFNKQKGLGSLELRGLKTDIYQVFLLETGLSKTTLYNTQKTMKVQGIPYTEAPKNW